MAARAESIPQPGAKPKRHLRNYLLDKRFQLKYTGMVVAVALVVAGVLGAFAYHYSQGMTEALTIRMAMDPNLDPALAQNLEGFAKQEDRKVLLSILGGIGILGLVLGVTGIVVTHRLVGPAYKLKRLFSEVAEGHLRVVGKLRKGDELQDVFLGFEAMIDSLRARQQAEIEVLDEAIERARAAGTPQASIDAFIALRDRMKRELD